MNYGIGNVKAKSSGSEMPTITITQEQEIETNTYVLTAEQYQLIVDNAYKSIVVSFMNSNLLMSIGFGNSEDAYTLTHIYYSDEELIISQCDVIVMFNNDKVLSFNNDTFTKAKQLYQHNICLYKFGTRYYDCMYLEIKNDNSNALTSTDILEYLENFPFDNSKPEAQQTKMCKMWGWTYDSNQSTYTYFRGIQSYQNGIKIYTQSGSGTPDITTYNIDDTIIPL